MRRRIAVPVIFGIALVSLPVTPVIAQESAPETVSAVVEELVEDLRTDQIEGVAAEDAAVSEETEAEHPFSMIGLRGTGTPDVEVRTANGDDWSDWIDVEMLDVEDGPDPDSSEDIDSQLLVADQWIGEGIWVGEATRFQVRVSDGDLSDVEVHTIDTMGLSEGTWTRIKRTVGSLSTASPAEAYPGIVTRSGWGANESLRRGSPSYSTVRFAVLHHTAGSNSYTRAQSAGVVRGIYDWHVRGNGWSDIGYNFLVDRYGTVYEGRFGGIDRGVVGAHAAGWNSGSFGVGLMGNFDVAQPPAAAIASMTSLMAWKYQTHGINSDPAARVSVNGRTMPTMVGHRDVGSTACPGRYVVSQMSSIRNSIHSKARTSSPPKPPSSSNPSTAPAAPANPWDAGVAGNLSRSVQQDLTTFDPRTGRMLVARSTRKDFALETWATYQTRTGWATHLHGDVSGNGRDDVVSFHPSNGSWWVAATAGSSMSVNRWGSYSTKTGWTWHGLADLDGDGRADLVSFHRNGTWWWSKSLGSRFAEPQRIATFGTTSGWQSHLVGNFASKSRESIANYHPATGRWTVLRLSGSTPVIESWATYGTTTGWTHQVGDFDGDGLTDIASYHRSGRWWVARSTGSSFRSELWATFATTSGWEAHVVGRFTQGSRDELVSYHRSGSVWLSRSTGSRFAGSRLAMYKTTSGWTNHVAVDVNGNGRHEFASFHPSNSSWWVTAGLRPDQTVRWM